MKTMLKRTVMLLSFFAIISGLIFALYSCSKDEDEILYNEVSKDNYSLHSSNDMHYETSEELYVNNSDRASIPIGLYIMWDAWGRKKYDCKRGFGLCNFRIEGIIYLEIDIVIKDQTYYAPIYVDRNSYYVNIPIDEKVIFEDNDKMFYIDEDLYAKAPDGNTYKLPAGIYSLDKSIGKMGGYRLPIQIVKI